MAIRDTVSRGLAMMLMLNAPATIGLMVLATPIVQLLFERGHFLPADTAATAAALRWYAVGLVGYSAVRIVSPTFYALGESRTPVLVSAGAIAVNVIASIALVRAIGFAGLALGTSIAAIVNAVVLLAILRRRLGGLEGRRLTVTLLKVTAASLVMAIAAVAIHHSVLRVVSGNRLAPQAVRLAATIAGSLAALAASAGALRIEAFGDAVEMVRSRVRKLLAK